VDILALCAWIEQTPFAAAMRNSAWLYDIT
jgi:hypothetical protein